MCAGVLRSVFGGGRVMGEKRGTSIMAYAPPPVSWVCGGNTICSKNSSTFNETSGRTGSE